MFYFNFAFTYVHLRLKFLNRIACLPHPLPHTHTPTHIENKQKEHKNIINYVLMCLLGLCAAQWEWQLPRWGPSWHWRSQSTLPAANFQLPASEPGLNNAYNDNNNKDGEMGKMEKTFPRRTRIRFGTRIRIRIRFHFNFTWRLLSFWIYI